MYLDISSDVSGILTLFVTESLSTVSLVLSSALLKLISAILVNTVFNLAFSETLHLIWISLLSKSPVTLFLALIKLSTPFSSAYAFDKFFVLTVLPVSSFSSSDQPLSLLKSSSTNSNHSGKWSVISSAYPSISPSL